jgi:predicted MFS family arabinose efflux permease
MDHGSSGRSLAARAYPGERPDLCRRRAGAVVLVSIAAWGIAFGGCATLFQTALAIAAGDGADVAQSLLVVTWNCAISGGGVIGGILLNRAGVASFPWTLLPLLIVSLVVAARTTGFRSEPSVASGRRPG